MPFRRPSRAALLVLGLVLALGLAGRVPQRASADEAPSPAEIARLIEQLGSKEFDEREAASKKLAAIGMPALEALLAAKASPDPEIRLRAERLIDAMRRAASRAAEVRKFEGHTGRVHHVAVTADGKTVLSASQDGTVRMWEIATGKEVHQLPGTRFTARGTAFSADGKLMAINGTDKSARLIETATGKELHRFATAAAANPRVDVSRDGKQLVTAATNNVTIWDAETGKEICRLAENTGLVRSVAFSPDGKQVVTCSSAPKFRLCLWDATTGKNLQRNSDITSQIVEANFSPDGKHIVTAGGATKCLALYDPQTLKEVRRIDGLADPVFIAIMSPDGRLILSAGGRLDTAAAKPASDYSIRLWDAQTGKEIQRMEGHTNSIHALAFTPDGKHAISGSFDNTVRMWKLMK